MVSLPPPSQPAILDILDRDAVPNPVGATQPKVPPWHLGKVLQQSNPCHTSASGSPATCLLTIAFPLVTCDAGLALGTVV